MSDLACSVVSNNKEKFETEEDAQDETDKACVKDEQQNAVSDINGSSADAGILKEQNYFVDNNGLISLSKLYSNRNCANGAYISSKKEKPIPALSDLRKVYNELKDNNQISQNIQNEEFTAFTKGKAELKENNSYKSISLKNSKPKEFHINDLNGSLGEDDHNSSNISDSSEVIYYAVHIPSDPSNSDPGRKDKEEVLNIVKSNKKARFKQFKTKKEAEDFALNGAEIISQDGSSFMTDNEKVMPFKRPKTEDMIQFKKYIEAGNIDIVREKIFENPKYLVSNGDTPSILQEGPRYNALHIAAKSKNAQITRLILDAITRLDFIGYLYDDNDIESCISRSKVLLDRYLNTPDKGANETPLHVAVKHGAVEVVEVLLSYSQCQKNNIFNRYKQLPKDMICSRVGEPCEEAKAAIASLLEEQYFIPVLRSEDNSLQPKVGEAFSISNPLKLESDLLSPRLEIRAYAGPMSKEKADLFKKKWKAPTRWAKDANSPLALRLRDTEKGLEKTGRTLASELDVPWQEYWSFLDTFIDISSDAGLCLLEDYLKNRFQDSFMDVKQKNIYNSSGESLKNSAYQINDLCEAFELCGASNEKQSPTNNNDFSTSTPRLKRTSLHSLVNQRDRDGGCKKSQSDLFKAYGKNPIVYVERSCEVFGKRIGAAINSCVLFENHSESLKESLETQVKHLQTLIKSYKEDSRFQAIDFQLIHSRVAAVAIQSLHNLTEENKQSILAALKSIDWSNGALSDDEDLNCNNKNHEWLSWCNKYSVTTKQLYCLVKHLIVELLESRENDSAEISPSRWSESDFHILWSRASPCKCVWTKKGEKKGRSGLKRKQFRNDCDCECETLPRKIQVEDESEDFVDSLSTFSDEGENQFLTPPSGNSDDSEDDVMEEVNEIPNTFIFPGALPSKMDFSVLEAIDKVPLSPEKYPNVYLWRHILQMLPKNVPLENHISNSDPPFRKPLNFDSPKSSPCKLLDRSLGSNESSPLAESVMEPWERVTGPYSPRRSSRSSLSMLYYQDSPTSR